MPSTKKKIFFIPGIDGMGNVITTLALHLKGEVICLQLGFSDHDRQTTIPKIAALLLDRAVTYLTDLQTDSFTIVGYSFGAIVALELAALLEARGVVGQLVLIDGSPYMLKTITREIITTDEEEEIQNNILASITNITTSAETAKKIKDIYMKHHTWDSKLESIFVHLDSNDMYSLKHLRNVFDSIYLRIKAISNYESNIGKLKSSILLIRPTQHSIITDIEDFGLSEFSDKPVSVQYVDGDHATVIDNPDCSHIINKIFIEDVILDKESVNTV